MLPGCGFTTVRTEVTKADFGIIYRSLRCSFSSSFRWTHLAGFSRPGFGEPYRKVLIENRDHAALDQLARTRPDARWGLFPSACVRNDGWGGSGEGWVFPPERAQPRSPIVHTNTTGRGTDEISISSRPARVSNIGVGKKPTARRSTFPSLDRLAHPVPGNLLCVTWC